LLLAVVMGGLGVVSPWNPTLAAGVYLDAAGEVAFLTAPQSKALSGRIARSGGEPADASLFFLDASFAVKSTSLVEVDIPAVSLLGAEKVITGFGDVTIRGRTRLYAAPRRVLHLIGGLRTGTGAKHLFPYASRTVDLEVGVGYVDTLDVLQLWASGSGAYVGDQPDEVPDEDRHGHFGRVGAGVKFPFSEGTVNVGLGVMAVFFEAGRTRELLLADFFYHRSAWLTFTLFAHVEGGDRDERIGEYAAGGGFRVFY
jgi:hypothetical protein